MSEHDSFADAYAAGPREVLADGSHVPSVRDPLSKASDFGTKNRLYTSTDAFSKTTRPA